MFKKNYQGASFAPYNPLVYESSTVVEKDGFITSTYATEFVDSQSKLPPLEIFSLRNCIASGKNLDPVDSRVLLGFDRDKADVLAGELLDGVDASVESDVELDVQS